MSDDAGASSFVHLHDRATRIGQWTWFEQRWFEQLGRWAGTSGHPAVDVLFAEMSRRHGWHAQVLAERLPELASVDASSLVQPAGPGVLAVLDALGSLDAEPPAVARMVAAYRVVLPAQLADYRRTLGGVSPVAEPSLVRWLGLIVRDDLEEWARANDLLSELVDPGSVDTAARVQAGLERLVAASSGLQG